MDQGFLYLLLTVFLYFIFVHPQSPLWEESHLSFYPIYFCIFWQTGSAYLSLLCRWLCLSHGRCDQTFQTDRDPGPSWWPFHWLETARMKPHPYSLYRISEIQTANLVGLSLLWDVFKTPVFLHWFYGNVSINFRKTGSPLLELSD